jgi:hypothetical protein
MYSYCDNFTDDKSAIQDIREDKLYPKHFSKIPEYLTIDESSLFSLIDEYPEEFI